MMPRSYVLTSIITSIILQQTYGFGIQNPILTPSSQNNKFSYKAYNIKEISCTQLLATKQDKKRGIYSRPSAAIERGSGFFIPGLEGGRVRIAFGIVLILANVLNNGLGSAVDYSITEWIGTIFSILLIGQGVVEGIEEKNNLLGTKSLSMDSNRMEVVQSSKPSLSSTLLQELRWVGLTIFSLTSTTKFLIWDDENSLCFTLLSTKLSNDDNNDSIKSAIESARQSLSTSSTGTISVPNTHPIAGILMDQGDAGIILQRIRHDNSWGIILVTNQPVQQAFTKNDFRWLPVLASFIDSFI